MILDLLCDYFTKHFEGKWHKKASLKGAMFPDFLFCPSSIKATVIMLKQYSCKRVHSNAATLTDREQYFPMSYN